ncbi:MAG TPA: hypothetical protein VGB20_01495 [bacterium]
MHRRNRRGSLYIISYVFISMLSLAVAVGLQRGATDLRAAERQVELLQSFYLAEAAVDQALANIRAGTADSIQATALLTGTYAAVITSPSANTYEIIGQGTRSSIVQSSVEMIAELGVTPLFPNGVFGDTSVNLDADATIDSFDSTLGNYASQTPGSDGNLGTNSTEDDAVVLNSGAMIAGQVVVGAGASDPAAVVEDHGATITASPAIVAQSEPMEMPAVTSPGGSCAAETLANSEVLTLYEALSPYCFTSLLLKNSASIEVVGSVIVYAESFDAQNSAQVNASGSPTQLVLLITTDAPVNLFNSGGFVGAIYAPQSNVELKNGVELFGAITAESVDMKNSSFVHYDTALAGVNPVDPDLDMSVLSWRDL